MAPDQVYITQELRSIVIHLLDTFNYKNAEFACERLLALDNSNVDSMYLLCLTLFRQGRFKRVFNLASQHLDHLGCVYLYARSSLQLGKFKEGIFALLEVDHLYNETIQSTHWFHTSAQRLSYEKKRQLLPDLLAIFHILGDLYTASGDTKNAAFAYTLALKDNQFDFEAFQKLVRSGVNVHVHLIYKSSTNKEENFSNPFAGSPIGDNQLVLNSNVNSNPIIYSSNNNSTSSTNTTNTNGNNNNNNTNINNFNNHLDAGIAGINNQLHSNVSLNEDDTFAGIASSRVTKLNLRRSNYLNHPGANEIFTKPAFPPETTNESKKILKSSYSKFTLRLTNSKDRLSLKRNSATANATLNNNIGNHGSGGILDQESQGFLRTLLTLPLDYVISSGESYLLSLYHLFAKGYKCLCKYDCYKAIRILELLPDHEKNTPWVLAKLGRLHYEIVNYKKLEYFFVKLRQLDRTRLEDMEYYLTLLWHLNKKVDLTFLANELYDLDPNLAITWCVIGNLFSLSREPDEAVKCFNKAVKIDSKFTYAFTLKGHEYFSNDNYEMALENFRTLLLIDPRHYNALYGIGMVYINLGDYQKADFHFRKAVLINPINVILICCVGMVLEKAGKRQLALKQYDLAKKLQPLNPLPVFKKAQLLFTMQEFPQALEYFEKLKELAPEEALVHFLLGQLYKIQNDKFKAIREFTIALLLDPKGNYMIRDAMESLKN